MLFSYFTKPQEKRILIQGLDAAGKTTILYKLKLGDIVTTIPTIGFNVEKIEHKYMVITAWDLGGRGKMRSLWRHYYPNTDAFVYVIDSNDRDRFDQARDELIRTVLMEDDLRNVPILIFANKQDLPNAISVADMSEKLGLGDLFRYREYHIQPLTATTGNGLHEGMDWLTDAMKKQKKNAIKIKANDTAPAKNQTPFTQKEKSSTIVNKSSLFACLMSPFTIAFGSKAGTEIYDTFKYVVKTIF